MKIDTDLKGKQWISWGDLILTWNEIVMIILFILVASNGLYHLYIK
jgi:hypothetical protein